MAEYYVSPDDTNGIQGVIDEVINQIIRKDNKIIEIVNNVHPGNYRKEKGYIKIDGNTDFDGDGFYDSEKLSGNSIIIKSISDNPVNTLLIGDLKKDEKIIQFLNTDTDEYNKLNLVLRGLTIKKGSNTGIYCLDSSPKIENCIIEENGKYNININGGGTHCLSSNPQILGCKIEDNKGWRDPNVPKAYDLDEGGGILCKHSNLKIINCYISKNQSWGPGSGISCIYRDTKELGADLLIINCSFYKNYAINEYQSGGAIKTSGKDKLTIKNCIFYENYYPGKPKHNRILNNGECIIADSCIIKGRTKNSCYL